MSWLTDLQNIEFSIKTGDGKIYKPHWKGGEKNKDYNHSIFNFINLKGSLVDRKKPQSTKYPLTFWFQGDNHLIESKEFEISADESRYWEVTHPFYGLIKGQPINISFNNNNYNVTEITVDFWETIIPDLPQKTDSTKDIVSDKNNLVSQSAITSYATGNFKTTDIQKNKDVVLQTNSNFYNEIGGEENGEFQVLVNASNDANDNLLNDSKGAISSIIDILKYSSTSNISTKLKIKSFLNTFNDLNKTLVDVTDKLFFEALGANIVSNLCNSSVNYQAGDYNTVNDVYDVVNSIISVYYDYLLIIDSNFTQISDLNYWNADPVVQSNLNNMVNYTVVNLFNLALNAKTERIVFLEKDSNLILLTHKYMGLASDENMDEFRKINNISMDELFNIKKGREIKYYKL